LAESVKVCAEIIAALDQNIIWTSNNQTCEPFLSKYGIYPTMHSVRTIDDWKMAILWIMNLADGKHDLLEISRISGLAPKLLHQSALKLEQVGLLRRAN
jgi:aminopeptidase-like protein